MVFETSLGPTTFLATWEVTEEQSWTIGVDRKTSSWGHEFAERRFLQVLGASAAYTHNDGSCGCNKTPGTSIFHKENKLQ